MIIIRRVIRSPNRRNDIYHRLICGLSFSDVISSSAYFLGTWLIPHRTIGGFGMVYGAIGNHATCSLSGFLTQMAIASPLYNGTLSLYYLLTIKYNWPSSRIRIIEKWLHFIPMGYALLSSSIALGLNMYGNVEWLCWIKPDVPEGTSPTGAQRNFVIFQWVFLFGPLWLTVVFVSLVFYVLYRKVRENEKKMEKYKFTINKSSSHDKNKQKQQEQQEGGQEKQERTEGGEQSGPLPAVSSLVERETTTTAAVTRCNDADNYISSSNSNNNNKNSNNNVAEENHKLSFVATANTENNKHDIHKEKQAIRNSSFARVGRDDGWKRLRKSNLSVVAGKEEHKHDSSSNIVLAASAMDKEAKKYCQQQKAGLYEEEEEEEKEEEQDCKLTWDEEMAIKKAASTISMKQYELVANKELQSASSSTSLELRDIIYQHNEDDHLSSSDVIGKRKSVTFSTMLIDYESNLDESNRPSMSFTSSNDECIVDAKGLPSSTSGRSCEFRSSFQSTNSLPLSDRSSQSSIMGLSHSAFKRKKTYYEKASKSRQIAIQGILFSCAFYFTWFFPTLQRITEVAMNKNFYIIQCLDTFLLPLQGVFNFAIYIRPRFIAFKMSNPQAGFWKVLWKVSYETSSEHV